MSVSAEEGRHSRVQRLYHAKPKNTNQRPVWLSDQPEGLPRSCRLVYLKMKTRLVVDGPAIRSFIETYKRSPKPTADTHGPSLPHAQRHSTKYMATPHTSLHSKKFLSKLTSYRQSSAAPLEAHRPLSSVYRCPISPLKARINRPVARHAWYSAYRCRKQEQ